MTDNLVDPKYGYVENVDDENKYKNIDYRDTTVPLWSQLHKELINSSYCFDYRQRQINIALCASIIQLGNSITDNFNYIHNLISKIDESLINIEAKLND